MDALTSTSAPVPRAPVARLSQARVAKPPSPAQMRAQRANAQLSTGPRTRQGRRRSSLNRLGAKTSGRGFASLNFPGQRDFLHVWRDLLALFWFIKPEWWREDPRLEFYLRATAWAWTQKLPAVRSGARGADMNESIQSGLSCFIFEFRVCNQKCHYWLQKEFGVDGRTDIVQLREAIEARLSSFIEAGKSAKNALGSFGAMNPPWYQLEEIGVRPIFTPPNPGIFQKRTRSRKLKREKELELEWPRFRVRF